MTVVRPWRLTDDGSTKICGALHSVADAGLGIGNVRNLDGIRLHSRRRRRTRDASQILVLSNWQENPPRLTVQGVSALSPGQADFLARTVMLCRADAASFSVWSTSISRGCAGNSPRSNALACVRAGVENLHFAWAGPLDPGQPHLEARALH